jgi:hypothetical protein
MDDDLGPFARVREIAISGEVCLEVCSRHCSLCLHLFFNMMDLESEISNLRSEI